MAKKLFILLIILLGIGWRFYRLSDIPNGMYVDETVIGYNAYSLSVTGGDEYGVKWPVFLRSFGAFSAPLYTYVTAGVVKLWGLNNLSVRATSAVAGTILVILTYLILRQLGYPWWLRAVGLSIVSFSPWSVFLSRIALEGHLSLCLIVSACYLFLKVKKNSLWWLAIGSILSLSAWTYQGARPVALGLLIGFVLISKKTKWLWCGVGMFVLILIPQLLLIRMPAFTQRGVGLLYTDAVNNLALRMGGPVWLSRIFAFLYEFCSQAAAYLSPFGLFWKPDEDLQRSLPELSNFSPLLVVFYLPGFLMIKEKLKKQEGWFWLLLLAVGLAVPALTRDPFSSVRGQFLIFPLVMVIVWGVEWWSRNIGRFFTATVFAGVMLASMLWLWRSLIVLLPYQRAGIWDYGFEQLAAEIKRQSDVNWVVEQTRQEPVYIELLYYWKYPPERYQAIMGDWQDRYYSDTNYDLSRKIGNIEIRDIDWKKDIFIDQILVGDELSISDDQAKEHFLTKVLEIRDPAGRILFRGYKTDPDRQRMKDIRRVK